MKESAVAERQPAVQAARRIEIHQDGQIRGQVRAVVDAVLPEVDGGRFAAKAIVGRPYVVRAHCFADGHDRIRVRLQWQADEARNVHEVEMEPEGNDVWTASFTPPQIGRYAYTVTAWVDAFDSWRHDLARRDDIVDVRVALQVGALLVEEAADRARGDDRRDLKRWAATLARSATSELGLHALQAIADDADLVRIARRHPDRRHEARFGEERQLVVDPERAGFSSWYELFPRSASPEPGRHGTLRDVQALLPYVAGMGFDVLYLPPIHPIGRVNRKGRNNARVGADGDVGSPWAIGAAEGGHTEILPELGTLDDFRALVEAAREHGIQLALDIAFQCAPDHPWVKAHPQWFRHRPDGSVQYAENPPKKYQDIYPFDFETDDWRALWDALKGVFDHWIAQGVTIFRVDNPHTKAFPFWEWAIGEIKREHPDVLFLAEAFTRPKVMHRLAKLGYSQSYTYYTWRNSKAELIEYFTELAHGPGASYFRPNVWPNTPDILHERLQSGKRATFIARLVLAATLSSNYGVYGPAFELMEHQPREPGSEEYRDSEKYQLRRWDLAAARSLSALMSHVNAIRRTNPALQSNDSLAFVPVDNDQLIAYLKHVDGNAILTVVNLDPDRAQSGWVDLDLGLLGLDGQRPYVVHDLLDGQRYEWRGGRNYVLLRPEVSPAHILRIEGSGRTERDMERFQ
ncbi:MAG: alpha-1,4-glucan--maltose-1-phosphate maltosyltransferase [Proteobacteria bacterium]|nr:alpha-1,4-glucan--maltose-1-phosphate maltosyltransferase [Pseudomonadota bacterium]